MDLALVALVLVNLAKEWLEFGRQVISNGMFCISQHIGCGQGLMPCRASSHLPVTASRGYADYGVFITRRGHLGYRLWSINRDWRAVAKVWTMDQVGSVRRVRL